MLIIKTFNDLCLDDRENLLEILNPVVLFILKNGIIDDDNEADRRRVIKPVSELSKGDQKDHVKFFYIMFLFNLTVMSRGKHWGKENPEDSYWVLLGVVRVSKRLL